MKNEILYMDSIADVMNEITLPETYNNDILLVVPSCDVDKYIHCILNDIDNVVYHSTDICDYYIHFTEGRVNIKPSKNFDKYNNTFACKCYIDGRCDSETLSHIIAGKATVFNIKKDVAKW